MTEQKILTLHPEGKQGTRIDRDKYDAMKKAILAILPRKAEGFAFKELPRAVSAKLPRKVYGEASVSWYCTTVKLDLEARGLIERVPRSSPQRLRRTR